METSKLGLAIAMALTGILFLGTGCATTKAEAPAETQAQDHEKHHPENQAQDTQESSGSMMGKEGMMGDGMMKNGMMDKMDMTQMKGMMHECMEMHKDGKMCDHNTMGKCQEKMGKAECKKMMTQMKSKEKSENKKK